MGCDMSDDEPSAGPMSPLPPRLFNREMMDQARIESIARHPATADPLARLEEMKPLTMSPLTVHADVTELLDHFDGDKAKVFEFLGELRDLLG